MKINKIFLIIIIIIISVSAIFGIYLWNLFARISPETEEAKKVRSNFKINWSDRVNILLIGCDNRKNMNIGVRSDTMILANIDFKTKKIKFLSIPRDTRVFIPGHDTYDKINSTINPAYWEDGGIALTLKTLENLLNVPIKLYVKVDFEGFKKIVDSIGGIKYNVEKDMYYYDPTDGTLINLKAGEQILDGDKALQYVRFRNDAQGDFARDSTGKIYGRVSRQMNFMKAVALKLSENKNILKISNLINIISRYVETNISSSELLKAAITLKEISVDKDVMVLNFPGNAQYIDDLSYVVPNEEELKELVEKELNTVEPTAPPATNTP
jgi:LCP family protein required for cell wall assembly